jgi:hypothetical protein
MTLSDAVQRAVLACDPDAHNERLNRMLERFEDADEPLTAISDLDARLADAETDVDGEIGDPEVSMTVATVLYLAHRRDMIDSDDEDLLRLTARAEWQGDPPQAVSDWLVQRGVTV